MTDAGWPPVRPLRRHGNHVGVSELRVPKCSVHCLGERNPCAPNGQWCDPRVAPVGFGFCVVREGASRSLVGNSPCSCPEMNLRAHGWLCPCRRDAMLPNAHRRLRSGPSGMRLCRVRCLPHTSLAASARRSVRRECARAVTTMAQTTSRLRGVLLAHMLSTLFHKYPNVFK